MNDDWSSFFRDNEAAWDARVPVHARSAFYDVEAFRRGASTLQGIELELVGNVAGKSLLHLQCHFGLDTLSWARLGARVVGVDFSGPAVDLARALAEETGLSARFVRCNVLDTRQHLSERFDLVFASYGVIGWLPDLGPWAEVVAQSLAPEGRFVLVEFHPFLWISQHGPDLNPRYSYFNRGPITEQTQGTYADRDSALSLREHGWNHPMSEIHRALRGAGLEIVELREYDYSPYDVFPNLLRGADGGYRFRDAEGLVPMILAIEARA